MFSYFEPNFIEKFRLESVFFFFFFFFFKFWPRDYFRETFLKCNIFFDVIFAYLWLFRM